MARFLNIFRLRDFTTAADTAAEISAINDTQPRLKIDAGGKHLWGDGSTTGDTNLYRSGANLLKTDDTFEAGGLIISTYPITVTGASVGNVLTFDGSQWIGASVSGGGGGGSSSITVSDTAPATPTVGDLWFDSTSGKTYVFYDNFWVQQSAGADGKDAVITEGAMISAVGGDGSANQVLQTNGSGNLSFGDVAYDAIATTGASAGSVMIYNGSSWAPGVVEGLVDGAVTTSKIADGAVTPAKLAPSAALANNQVGAILLMEMM